MLIAHHIFNGYFAFETSKAAVNRLLKDVLIQILLQTLLRIQVVLQSFSIRIVFAHRALLALQQRVL